MTEVTTVQDAPANTPAKILSIVDMVDAEDIQYVIVSVPEWGGEVRLGSISAGGMLDELETVAKNVKNGGDREGMIRLVVRSIVDADGTRVPIETMEDLVSKFKKKDVRVINRLVEAALKLNGVPMERDESKNDSGEVNSVASPTASQPPVAS